MCPWKFKDESVFGYESHAQKWNTLMLGYTMVLDVVAITKLLSFLTQ